MERVLIAFVVFVGWAGACAQESAMNKEGAIAYACGGVGAEGRREMRALEEQANVALLFATAKRAGYVADVSVAVTDAKSKSVVLSTLAEGPMCVLRLAPGTYRIEAGYEGASRSRLVTVPNASGSLLRIGFGFPEEPWDGIRADEEEKRQARQ